jgi:glycine C-acetyltransferase/8-amino-7-oxononanoate synthase
MPVMQSPPGAYTVIDGRRCLYFAGTGYLGLQGHPEVIRAACDAAERFGIGSATSRTRTGFGDTPPILDVERLAAEFFGLDDAFYFASGYLGNTVLATVLCDAFDAVFLDERSHYCEWDAARLSGRPVISFAHRDPGDLGEKLRAQLPPGERPLVLTDGIFAAVGSMAPVAEYRDVLAAYPGSILAVDDAHGFGVLGEHGRGTLEHAGLWSEQVNGPAASPAPALLVCGTCSKAIGGYGGIIPGSRALIERLKGRSHVYSGASAPSNPVAAATAKAFELLLAQPDLRRQLAGNAATLKRGLRKLGLATDDSPVPIASLVLGDAANMQRIQRTLADRGISIAYFAAYAGLGPAGALRIAVFATHSTQMIDELVDSLAAVV